jgi:Holliday junction resolvase RusA-like endonuclease
MGRHGVYTPEKTRTAERDVQIELMTLQDRPLKPTKCPVIVSMAFVVPIPQSWSKKRRESLIGKPHTQRPDLDNFVKLVADAANGILWEDDSQISTLTACKLWGDVGYIDLIVEEL